MTPATARSSLVGLATLLAVVVLALPGSARQSAGIEITRSGDSQPFGYAPKDLKVAAGTTVTWTNPQTHGLDGAAENHPTNCRQGTSKGTCPWVSEPLPPGGSFTVNFPDEGTFTYFCAVHPYMEGRVIVGDGEPAPAPTASPAPSPSPTPTPSPTPSPSPRPSSSPSPNETPAPSPSPSPAQDPTPAATPSPATSDSTPAEPAASDEPTQPPAAAPSATPAPTASATPIAEATTAVPAAEADVSDDPGPARAIATVLVLGTASAAVVIRRRIRP